MIPTLTTSRENTAAAMGVPKRAENAALMPHIMEPFSDGVADAAAELQSGALPSGRTTAKVGNQCGQENQRSHPQRNFVAGVDGGQDEICSGVLLFQQSAVEGDDDDGPNRKQKQKLRMQNAQLGNQI